jgi:hypothetical protein
MGFKADPDRIPRPNVFEPIPRGEYEVAVVEASYEVSKKDGTRMVKARFDLTEEPYQNRCVFVYFCIEHSKDETRERAIDDMNQFLLAAGCKGWDEPEELIGLRVVVQLGIKKGTKDYPDPTNSVQGYLPCERQGSGRAYNDPNPKRSTQTGQRTVQANPSQGAGGEEERNEEPETKPAKAKGWK